MLMTFFCAYPSVLVEAFNNSIKDDLKNYLRGIFQYLEQRVEEWM